MIINILNDGSTDLTPVRDYYDKNSIKYNDYYSIESFNRYILEREPEHLLVPWSMFEKLPLLSGKAVIVIIDSEYSSAHLLAAFRSTANNYFSLDEKSGDLKEVITSAIKKRNDPLGKYFADRHYKAIAEHAYHSEFLFDPEGNMLYQSPSIERMTGYPSKLFMEDSPEFFLNMLFPHDLEDFKKAGKGFMKDTSLPPLVRKFRIVTSTGELRWWQSTVTHIFDENGTYIGKRGTSIDITKEVLAEQEKEKIINEKELLIKEVHHRVKNNLAVMSSILNLQELYLHDERDNYILEILQHRINSMIAVHELLYSGDSTDRFSLEDLAKTICMNLIQDPVHAEKEIEITYKINPVPLDAELASPLGLILNELITNCAKYAFDSKTKGRIYIGSSIFNGFRTLYVGDDGNGYPEEVLKGDKHNLGLLLVNSLSSQIGGELFLNNDNGAQAVITFNSDR